MVAGTLQFPFRQTEGEGEVGAVWDRCIPCIPYIHCRQQSETALSFPLVLPLRRNRAPQASVFPRYQVYSVGTWLISLSKMFKEGNRQAFLNIAVAERLPAMLTPLDQAGGLTEQD